MNGRNEQCKGLGAMVASWALIAAPVAALGGPVNPAGVEDARLMLTRYAEQSYLQSGDLADLYSDAAWIRVRAAEGGAVRTFRGRTFKQGLREALGSRRSALDASQFRDATVERHGSRLVIRAKRYAVNRCYWDPAYSVELERDNGQWLIVAETMTLRPQARCAPDTTIAGTGTPPALMVQSTVAMAAPPAGPAGELGAAPAIGGGADPLAGLEALAMPPGWGAPLGPSAPLDPRIEEVLRMAQQAAGEHGAAAGRSGADVPGAYPPPVAPSSTLQAGSLWVTPK